MREGSVHLLVDLPKVLIKDGVTVGEEEIHKLEGRRRG